MNTVILAPGRVVRSWHPLAELAALLAANPGDVYLADGPLVPGQPLPDSAVAATPADAAAGAGLLVYANRRRREISEGADGRPGRIVTVPLAIGDTPFPIDATTRAALGDAAFQTTLANGDSYEIQAWLLPTGRFVRLDADDIMTAAKAVAAAFQGLFEAQARAFAAILDGTAATVADVDAILGT